MNRKSEICNAFNKKATGYESVAKIQYEIGERLFERLDYLNIQPRYVLDLGCGTGRLTEKLRQYYPKATVIGLDFSKSMLSEAKKKQRLWHRWPLLRADMMRLPFESGCIDMVLANQVIHWSDALPDLFSELNRVMALNGCLMFSTLGPDTFKEIRQAWMMSDNFSHTLDFPDMHDVGDSLMQALFLDPVMDMERITVHYSSIRMMLDSLKAQGVRNINPKRNAGLTGKGRWHQFEQALSQTQLSNGQYPLSYEVVFGHAWKGARRIAGNSQEAVIPISSIKKIMG